jgi:hypothetical protein
MTQDVLERLTSRPAKDRVDEEVLARLEAYYQRRREREWRETADQLEALRTRFADERREAFPDDMRARIARSVEESSDPQGPGRRYRSLAEARTAGLDLDRLKSIHDRAHSEFRDIVMRNPAFSHSENVRHHLYDLLTQPPFHIVLPDPDREKLYFAPYDGSWDRFEQNQASGDGSIDENFSYLDGGMARLGARLRAHNHDASDVDLICAYREGGYLAQFTTLKTGILQVKADLTALLCRHFVSTDDEWGWSDFHAVTRGRLIMAVFWRWEDVDPASEVSDDWFVAGLDCSGDGESFPGTSVQATPGERRIVNLFTDMAFPAGQNLWVYVGLSDRIWAFLNDVSIDISIDSAWQLNSIAIRSI